MAAAREMRETATTSHRSGSGVACCRCSAQPCVAFLRNPPQPARASAGAGFTAAAPRRAPDHRRSRAYGRSEEHTSELQSLMRNSYAVFCLKKKTVIDQQKMTLNKHTPNITHTYYIYQSAASYNSSRPKSQYIH